MLRRCSAASHRGKWNLQEEPRQGTTTRKIWDKLFERPGEFVDLREVTTNVASIANARQRLINEYNLDIRSLLRGGSDREHVLYCLAGEYQGRGYIDYVAEKV